jgi:exoribonuclease II
MATNTLSLTDAEVQLLERCVTYAVHDFSDIIRDWQPHEQAMAVRVLQHIRELSSQARARARAKRLG